jgi:CHASE2 domain-containing sensor protein
MTNSVKQLWRRITYRTLQLIPTAQDIKTLIRCLNTTHGLPVRLHQWWMALSAVRRHFLISLMIGLAITVLLHTFHKVEVLTEMEDKAMDWVMTLWEGTVSKEPVIPFGWIDIDEKAYLKWKEPLHVPRGKLANLIHFALQSHPKMVVIDIDLAQRNHARKVDEPVINVLKTHADVCKNKSLATENCPPVILLASLRTFESDLPLQRTSYLDELVDNSDQLYWASPLFEKDRDQIIRRWRIWESVRRETDNRIMALPSVQLLAATLLTSYEGAAQRLQSCLDAKVLKGHKTTSGYDESGEGSGKSCVNLWERHNALLDSNSQRSNETLSLSDDRVATRIVYTIPWQGSAAAEPVKSVPTVKTFEGMNRLLVSRVPALNLDNLNSVHGRADFQHRVVFIGGSFRDSRDIYVSPLGEMPGVLVLINALHSLLQYGEFEEVTLAHKVLINILLIVFLSIVFNVLDVFWGQIVASMSVIVVLVPLSVFMFGFGYWLDFALPLFAVQVYQMAVEWGQVAQRAVTGMETQSEEDGKSV